MMNFGLASKLAVAAVIAAAVPTAAQAVTYNLFNSALGSGTFGNNRVTSGSFIDSFTFNVLTPGTLFTDISSIGSGSSNIDFTLVRLTGPAGFLQNYDIDSTGTKEGRSLSTLITAGTYTLDVRGTSGSRATYSGNFNVTAVPEPATWALMIGGVGLVGGTMRRRKVSTKVTFA